MESNDIRIDIRLKCSPEDAWKMWTSSADVQKWLAPKANIEPSLGGLYELFWEPDKPEQNSTVGCRILAFVPLRLLAFEWKGPVPYADIMNVNPTPTWVFLSLDPVAPSHTMVHVRHSGWQTGTHWFEARQWMDKAWRTAFAELEKVLGGERAPLRVVPLS